MAGQDNANALSKPIVSIAVGGIAIGVAVMLVSIAVVTGFQRKITQKVSGFHSHVKVVDLKNERAAGHPIVIDHALLERLKAHPSVSMAQPFVQLQGLLQNKSDFTGVVCKGIDSAFQKHLIAQYPDTGCAKELSTLGDAQVIISRSLAAKLGLSVGQSSRLYVVRSGKPGPSRKVKVVGIYHTGMPPFDERFVFISLPWAQKLAKQGMEVSWVGQVNHRGDVDVQLEVFGGERPYDIKWSGDQKNPGVYRSSDSASVQVSSADNSLSITLASRRADTTFSKDNHHQWADGYEFILSDPSHAGQFTKFLDDQLPVELTYQTAEEDSPEIFSWLEILNVNVYLIIFLLAAVALVNMSSALLIIILEKSQMIGVMKALGSRAALLQRVFVWYGTLLVGKGVFWGNVIGFSLLTLQWKTELFTLPEEQYYVHAVPVSWEWQWFLLLNAGLLLVSFTVLLIPAWLVARMNPLKAIRYD
ncbi:MAG TPA: ABC transporter permease [Luteibaculaceae bacterium]|nr:ABC transporter permease [Luteibaculaceae bacterium]